MSQTILLGSTYLGPVQYFQKIVSGKKIVIEQYDHYTKQTYRNRCDIYSSNGRLSLTIPVVKGRERKKAMKDVRIAYDEDWQGNHLKALTAAYKSSPFFEYYMDDLLPFYTQKWDLLLDFNRALLEAILKNIEGEFAIAYSNEFMEAGAALDFRDAINPKKDFLTADPDFKIKEYRQVFTAKSGFLPNLSIIDLLFNKGPEAIFFLSAEGRMPSEAVR